MSVSSEAIRFVTQNAGQFQVFMPAYTSDLRKLDRAGVSYHATDNWDDVLRQLSRAGLWARHPSMGD